MDVACGVCGFSFSNMVMSTLDWKLRNLCPLETWVCDVFIFPKFSLVAPHALQDANTRGVEINEMCSFKFPVTVVGYQTAAAPSGWSLCCGQCLPWCNVQIAVSPSLNFWLTEALTQSLYVNHFGNNNSPLLLLSAHWIVTTSQPRCRCRSGVWNRMGIILLGPWLQ